MTITSITFGEPDRVVRLANSIAEMLASSDPAYFFDAVFSRLHVHFAELQLCFYCPPDCIRCCRFTLLRHQPMCSNGISEFPCKCPRRKSLFVPNASVRFRWAAMSVPC